MTRKKKSRKSAPAGAAKLSKDKLNQLRVLKEQRVKKHKGAKPGSRNAQEALQDPAATSNSKAPSDSRIGSKKPVELIPSCNNSSTAHEPQLQRHLKPQVALKKVVVELSPEQELEELENDGRLMKLLERHEQGELLTGKEAKFFNRSIARHQQLCELLGIDDEFEEQDAVEDDPMAQYMSNDLADEWLSDDEEK
jgi:uncharacterized protein